MLYTALLIIMSFFAVIGFLECILTLLETISTSKYKTINKVSLVVGLSGRIENITFLLNTLILQAERINYKTAQTDVIVKDLGLDAVTLDEIHNFCLENTNIRVEK